MREDQESRAGPARCLSAAAERTENFHLLQSIPLSRVDDLSRPPRCSNPHRCMFITAGKDSAALHHRSAESASGRTVYSSPSLFVIYYSLIVMIMSAENVKCWKDSHPIYSTMRCGGFIHIASVEKQQWQGKLPSIRRKPWVGSVPWGQGFRVLKRRTRGRWDEGGQEEVRGRQTCIHDTEDTGDFTIWV